MKWLRDSMTIRMMMLQGGIKPLLKVIMQVLGISGLTKDTAGGTLVNGRSSVATVEDFEGNILDCLANEIRYKYGRRVDHGDGIIYNAGVAGIEYFNTDTFGAALATPMRILDEGAGENLISWSNDLTQLSEFGSPTLTTDTFTRTTTEVSYLAASISKAATELNYVLRVKAKPLSTNYVSIRLQGSYPARVDICVNVLTGTIKLAYANTFTNLDGSVNAKADGFYEIIIKGTSDADTTLTVYISVSSKAQYADATDDIATSSAYFKDLDLKQSKRPSSLIRTSGAPASRSADSTNLPVIEGTNFVNAGGALVFDVTMGYDSDTTLANMLGVGSSGGLLYDSATINTLSSSDATTTDNIGAIFTAGDRLKISVAWSASESLFSINYSTDNGSTWQAWSQATYDGAFSIATAYEWFKDNPYSNELHESTVYKSRSSATLIEVQDWIEANN